MIKKILKVTRNLMILIIGITSLYLINLFYMKPFSIDHFLGKELAMELVDSPEALTYIGIFDRFNWITKHNSKLSIPEEGDLENEINKEITIHINDHNQTNQPPTAEIKKKKTKK